MFKKDDSYSVAELQGMANEAIHTQRGDSKKMQKAFWDHLSNEPKLSSLIKLT
jgi:hypothetical protein